MEMPLVLECPAGDCAFNSNNACHAGAVTVGDGLTPICDSFVASTRHPAGARNSGVGPCKVSACAFNSAFTCGAESVAMGEAGETARCLTFSV